MQRAEAAILKEKRAQAAEAKEARRRERTERQMVPDLAAAKDDDKNVLDNILNSLASGDAFASKGRRSRRTTEPGSRTDDDGGDVNVTSMLNSLRDD